MTTFTLGAVSVALERDPVRPFAADTSRYQQTGLDSAGNRYVTDRSAVTSRPVSLVFPRVTAAEFTALRDFLNTTVASSRRVFTWTDHAAVEHTVRLNAWKHQQTHPHWWRVELTLTEIITPVGWDMAVWEIMTWA